MANEEHLALLKQGVEVWNEWRWRKQNLCITPDLAGADLAEADLGEAYLGGADLSGADLDRAYLDRAYLGGANLTWANLTGANLGGANLIRANLIRANLGGANLNWANLAGTYLIETTLTGADLTWADLTEAKLSEADLSGATLIDAHLIRTDLREAKLIEVTLTGADLSGADLTGADLTGADLCINLVKARKANLRGGTLTGANLTGADLTGADLTGADLTGAKLGGAALIRAYLTGANLTGAKLTGADLHEANLSKTVFGNINLSDVKGLGSCKHLGPSIIDHQTLQRSGPLPLAFLRGVGLPGNLIDYLPSLLNQPIQFYSCFISYSSKDEDFARRLEADLQSRGIRCWFAPHDMDIGDEIRTRIDEEIRIHEKLLLVLSAHSIDSTWVKKEVETAFEKEAEHKKLVLFPVRLDDAIQDSRSGWAADIRRARHIGDFTRWKDHDAYRENFDRLLRALKVKRGSENSPG